MLHSLLSTKLSVPPTRRLLISRPRLLERLNSGLDGELTSISAPAGFGKTTHPAERLPEWLADLHQFLPVKHAADAIRGSLAEAYAPGLGQALLILTVWCVASLGATYTVVSRRR